MEIRTGLHEWALKDGYHIKENDNITELWHENKCIARFSQSFIEITNIGDTVSKYRFSRN